MAGHNERKICVAPDIWAATWLGLRQRGRGVVESAAVWAGQRVGQIETVEAVYFLDDLQGHRQQPRYHRVPARSLTHLFDQLQTDRRLIIADIHTHPSDWVDLSPLDKLHPIEFRVGIHAIVIPSYATGAPSFASSGVHEYVGQGEWRTLSEEEKQSIYNLI